MTWEESMPTLFNYSPIEPTQVFEIEDEDPSTVSLSPTSSATPSPLPSPVCDCGECTGCAPLPELPANVSYYPNSWPVDWTSCTSTHCRHCGTYKELLNSTLFPAPSDAPESAQHSPPPPEASPAEESGSDVTDGLLSSLLLDVVKALVSRLLQITLYTHQKDICYGCVIDHPSQTQHECLWGIPEHFLWTHFDEVKRRLWNVKLIPAVLRLLDSYGLHTSESKIQGVIETFLYEWKQKPNIINEIAEINEGLVGDDLEKQTRIDEAVAIWQG
ncbi:uncharacterized protein LOC113172129 [Anabas testudineus]|uniref:uncharacterized protein LOC113172129 n=1 Tax=Anabas testudineus TaxID=64144 RepID=UPI000E45AE4E|nr:uncharacterized protein LOC113172129 [Anabas testudineus]